MIIAKEKHKASPHEIVSARLQRDESRRPNEALRVRFDGQDESGLRRNATQRPQRLRRGESG